MTPLDELAGEPVPSRGGILSRPCDWDMPPPATPIGTAVRTADRTVGTVALYRWSPATASYRYGVLTSAGALVTTPLVFPL